MSGALTVRPCTPDETADLRREVLRGGRTDLPLDDGSAAHHVGAFDGDELVATGNIRPDPAAWSATPGPHWRIRGMATDPARRGGGAGGQVVEALVAHALDRGATLVWCNARLAAADFYRGHGFVVHGDAWDEPEPLGPHVVMHRTD